MRNIALFLSLLLMAACSKDQVEMQLPPNGPFTKILSITYEDDTPSPTRTWTDTYTYDVLGALVHSTDFSSLPRHNLYTYYPDGKLKEIQTINTNDDQLLFRDSIEYDEEGFITQVFKFSINHNQGETIHQVQTFSYGHGRKLHQTTTVSDPPDGQASITKYFWDGNNISKNEFCSSSGKLTIEWSFEYDDKINYQRHFPPYLTNPLSWSQNNITQSSLIDHTGLIDPICFVCKTHYAYNEDDLPDVIQQPTGRMLMIEYE